MKIGALFNNYKFSIPVVTLNAFVSLGFSIIKLPAFLAAKKTFWPTSCW